MVLESLTNPFNAEQNPRKLFWIGFVYMSVAIFLSAWIFKSQSSLVMVFLATMASIPLMYNTILAEESKDLEGLGEKWLLKEHWKALSFFMWLFLGFTVACTFWYVVLPAEKVAMMFLTQTNTINAINARVTGALSSELTNLGIIFFNNLKVLIFCILFSFIYGSGAIFILTWNASVIGTAMGNLIRNNLAAFADLAGIPWLYQYLKTIGVAVLRYSIHGIPEILSYFFAGLAGGIISIAVIRHDFKTRKFEHILLDSADLLLISLVLLVIAALLEVYITPLLFTGQMVDTLLSFIVVILLIAIAFGVRKRLLD